MRRILVLAILLTLAGCASRDRPYQSQYDSMTPLQHGPGGVRLYKVDGPEGPQIITVVPGQPTSRGRPRPYHVIEHPVP